MTSQQKIVISRYDWNIAMPYWDFQFGEYIDSNRGGKRNITLREFKEMLEKDISIPDMRRIGISRHLLQFFSNWLQSNVILLQKTFSKRKY